MEIIKINSDHRGHIYQFDIGEKQHIIITFNEGVARGGHYHEQEQMHIILAGSFKILLHHIDTKKEDEKKVVEGDSILIPARVAHLFIAESHGVIAESRIGDYVATDYEPYRQLVRIAVE